MHQTKQDAIRTILFEGSCGSTSGESSIEYLETLVVEIGKWHRRAAEELTKRQVAAAAIENHRAIEEAAAEYVDVANREGI